MIVLTLQREPHYSAVCALGPHTDARNRKTPGNVEIKSPEQRCKDSKGVVESCQKPKGRVEDAMKSPYQEFAFCCVFATRVLRLYNVHGDAMTLVLRPSRFYRVLTAFQDRSPDLGVCFEQVQNTETRRSFATLATTTRCLAFLPRLCYAYRDLTTLSANFWSQ